MSYRLYNKNETPSTSQYREYKSHPMICIALRISIRPLLRALDTHFLSGHPDSGGTRVQWTVLLRRSRRRLKLFNSFVMRKWTITVLEKGIGQLKSFVIRPRRRVMRNGRRGMLDGNSEEPLDGRSRNGRRWAASAKVSVGLCACWMATAVLPTAVCWVPRPAC